MATITMEDSHSIDHQGEAASLTSDTSKRSGGWITFPFILATMAGLQFANGGWASNLIVYLITEYKVKNIDAALVANLVNGCGSLIPILAAVIADSFLGCFSVVWITSFISLVGTVLLLATSILRSSSSKPCENSSPSLCTTPSDFQFALLYVGIALATIGFDGVRSTLLTMGADQFHTPKNQSTFFNWFFFQLYITTLISSTAIVYVEDNVSWLWGFGFGVAANVVGVVIFLLGSRFYRKVKPQGSPFMGIARVVVATIRKRNVRVSMEIEDYYQDAEREMEVSAPTTRFRFLNRAALKIEGDIKEDGSIAKPWNLCSLQQAEDLKTLIKIMPLCSSTIFLTTPITIQLSLTILQVLIMDRSIGRHFKIPAGSISVFVLISTALCLAIFDSIIVPICQCLIRRPLTPLQRIGAGHVLIIGSMATSAIVEAKRLKIVHNSKHLHGSIRTISVLWLIPQLAFAGIGEAFYFPGQVALFYQEFPKPLKNSANAMIALLNAIAFYLSTAFIDLVRRVTGWLPDDLNYGRLDNLYWVMVIIGVLNFGYYIICAWFYKYQNVELNPNNDSRSIR